MAGHSIAYISVGSNLGDKLENCRRGIAALEAIPEIRVTGRSRFYKSEPVDFTAQVLNVDPEDVALGALELVVLKNGVPVESAPVGVPGAEHTFSSSGPGRYRVELRRGDALVAFTNPIYVKRKRK